MLNHYFGVTGLFILPLIAFAGVMFFKAYITEYNVNLFEIKTKYTQSDFEKDWEQYKMYAKKEKQYSRFFFCEGIVLWSGIAALYCIRVHWEDDSAMRIIISGLISSFVLASCSWAISRLAKAIIEDYEMIKNDIRVSINLVVLTMVACFLMINWKAAICTIVLLPLSGYLTIDGGLGDTIEWVKKMKTYFTGLIDGCSEMAGFTVLFCKGMLCSVIMLGIGMITLFFLYAIECQ